MAIIKYICFFFPANTMGFHFYSSSGALVYRDD